MTSLKEAEQRTYQPLDQQITDAEALEDKKMMQRYSLTFLVQNE